MDTLTPSNDVSASTPRAARLSPWFTVEGAILLLLGIAAIIVPIVAGIAVAVFLGWLLIFAGLVALVAGINGRGTPGAGWALLSAILALAAGILLLVDPWAGLATLTIVLAAYFIADGLTTITMAIAHRRDYRTGRWEWMLFNGIIDLVLAGIIIAGLPGTLTWVLGLIVGVDLIIGGMSLMAMGLALKRHAA